MAKAVAVRQTQHLLNIVHCIKWTGKCSSKISWVPWSLIDTYNLVDNKVDAFLDTFFAVQTNSNKIFAWITACVRDLMHMRDNLTINSAPIHSLYTGWHISKLEISAHRQSEYQSEDILSTALGTIHVIFGRMLSCALAWANKSQVVMLSLAAWSITDWQQQTYSTSTSSLLVAKFLCLLLCSHLTILTCQHLQFHPTHSVTLFSKMLLLLKSCTPSKISLLQTLSVLAKLSRTCSRFCRSGNYRLWHLCIRVATKRTSVTTDQYPFCLLYSVHHIFDWSRNYLLFINAKKCFFLPVPCKLQKTQPALNLLLGTETLPLVSSTKILGIILLSDLS